MFNVYNNLSETTCSDLFIRQENTNKFRRNREFPIPKENAVWNLSDFSWTRTHNHLVHKRILTQFG